MMKVKYHYRERLRNVAGRVEEFKDLPVHLLNPLRVTLPKRLQQLQESEQPIKSKRD